MTKLSVNINKVATLRNARGGAKPDLIQFAKDCEAFGAQGITIHPRPDERHIRYTDARALKSVVTTELNIEGYPNPKFMDLILELKPDQVTFVPDSPEVLTSNAGWDCKTHHKFLKEIIEVCHQKDIRTSLFLDPNPEQVSWAAKTGTKRIELYTEAFAQEYHTNKEKALLNYKTTAQKASKFGLELNAGHDLDLDNLAYFSQNIPNLKEVSIGHALISDALYFGIQNTIGMYLNQLNLD